MADSVPWSGVSVMPTLSVTDLTAACDYYTRLGFEEQWRYPEGSETTNIGMRLGDVSLMLWHCSEPANRQNLYIIMKNVRRYHDHLSTVVPELPPMVEADYGMLDFSITDPWGHLLTFGEAS